MVKFFSKDFVDGYTKIVAGDPEVGCATEGLDTTVLFVCEDKGTAFRAKVASRTLVVEEATPDDCAEFKFYARYDEWVRVAKGEARFQAEVVSGRVRFRGSMPKMLLSLNKVLKLEKRMLESMKAMDLAY